MMVLDDGRRGVIQLLALYGEGGVPSSPVCSRSLPAVWILSLSNLLSQRCVRHCTQRQCLRGMHVVMLPELLGTRTHSAGDTM